MAQGTVHVNCRSVFGDTAMHYAAHAGNVTGLEALLMRGAEVDARNNLQVS